MSVPNDEETTEEATARFLRNENEDVRHMDDTISLAASTPRLPTPLQILFGLNGLSLSLQSLALMYIINTQVAIPLPLLPTYGAIAFLPYSLKPLYAYLSQGLPRPTLIVGLMTACGLSIVSTTWIPSGGVGWCFVAAFVRGITDSWAEFTLGVTLIDQAQRLQQQQITWTYENVASLFQSQAATARNLGSLAGSFGTCLLLIHRLIGTPTETQLSGMVANTLLITTGIFHILGALVAWTSRGIFTSPVNTTMLNEVPLQDMTHRETENSRLCSHDDQSTPSSYSSDEGDPSTHVTPDLPPTMWNPLKREGNIALVVLLQLAIVSFSLQGPIVSWTSHSTWVALTALLVTALLVIAGTMYCCSSSTASYRVGMFLVLRHAIPSDSFVMGSFVYSLFASRPLQLQMISLTGMAVTTLSSWSYGKLLSHYSRGGQLQAVIAGTTILASLVSLSNIALVHGERDDKGSRLWILALVINLGTTFCGEWSFLPDVILATTSLTVPKQPSQSTPIPTTTTSTILEGHDDEENNSNDDDDEHEHGIVHHDADATTINITAATTTPMTNSASMTSDPNPSIAMEYGTFISCIDFGDQLGALLGGPLVAFLGIQRENSFDHLDRLIGICSLLNLLSLIALGLLPRDFTTPVVDKNPIGSS